MRRVLKICFVMAFVLILAGCGQRFDHQAYVQTMLDASYKGETAEYAKMINGTEEEVRALYEKNVEETASMFYAMLDSMKAFGVDVTDEQRDKVDQIVEKIYHSLEYETAGAEKVNDEHYQVSIKIKPLTTLKVWDEEVEESFENIQENVLSEEALGFDIMNLPEGVTMEEAEQAVRDTFGKLVYDMLDGIDQAMDAPEYGKEQIVTVDVKADTQKKLWYVPEEELNKINKVLIAQD